MQVAPLDDCIDPTVEAVVMMWASQTAGKTEVVNGITGYLIDQEPSPLLVVQPDIELARTWSEDRLEPMIRDTPILAELFRQTYNKRGNKILKKRFPGGHLTGVGANSPAGLAGRPIRGVLFDEIDRFPDSAGKEGDPIMLAEKRTETFPDAVIYKTSTPTIKNHSRIEKEWDRSDKNYWHVKCPYCQHEQTLIWKHVKWDDPEYPWYECINDRCDARWTDEERVAAVYGGRWIASEPFNGIRGYHLNGIYNVFRHKRKYRSRLHQMVAEFLKAKQIGKNGIKVWVNTFLCETWQDEQDVKPEWSKLSDHKEPYLTKDSPVIPKGVRTITAGTDFQADRIEVEFVGYGVGEESWGCGKHVIWGDTRFPEIYERLESLLIQPFKREDGATLTLSSAGFDTGYAACQRQLYAYLRPRLGRRYFAFKGANKKNAQVVSHSAKSKVEAVRLYMVGTNRIKTFLYSRATITAKGPGYMHFPTNEQYDNEYFKQFLSEESVTERIEGEEIHVFSMPSVAPENGTSRNEVLDIRVYSLAALYACGVPNWEALERRNLATIPKEGEEFTPRKSFILPRIAVDKAERKSRKVSGGNSLLDGLGAMGL